MKTLSIDIETYSSVNLSKTGVYPYAEAADFEILLFAYSIDDADVVVLDLAGGEVPSDVLDALNDPSVQKWAFNAQFERVCITNALRDELGLAPGEYLQPEGWYCSMVWSSALGLPLSLEQVGDALRLEDQKMSEGKKLIRLFSIPQTPRATKANPDPKPFRVLPSERPEEWATYVDYNRRDVEVELAIRDRLSRYPLPGWLWQQYWDDQAINDTGVRVDEVMAASAVSIDQQVRERSLARARELTGLDNPNSPAQVMQWLNENGATMQTMQKAEVEDALETATGAAREMLELRQLMSKSSVKKYEAMLNARAADGRMHGLVQFYGAGRTGRWAGRLVQMQNLPRNYMATLDEAREAVRARNLEELDLLYDSVPDVLSQLVRTAFVASEGNRLVVADYSAIEARVLAWLAGEQATLDAFRRGEDLYCATASQMFGVPVEKHGQNAELRQKGKIAVLACGYQGGVGAIRQMGGERAGMTEDEMQEVVTMWRNANPHVVSLWWEVQRAAINSIRTGETEVVGRVKIFTSGRMLFIELPSGRRLAYPGAGIGQNKFGGESITFAGVGKGRKMLTAETYGGKLVENVTQAVARDVLAHAIGRLRRAGLRVVMHIHDEVVIDAPPEISVQAVCDLIAENPPWAAGLPLDADGYECYSYRKD